MIDTTSDFSLVADAIIPAGSDDKLPPREHPAQRLMDASAEALADSELLALVFGTKSPVQSLNLSRRLLAAYGSLRELGLM